MVIRVHANMRAHVEPIAKRRERVVEEALRWRRTRFGHRQRTFNAEVDCAGLLVEVYERTGILPHIELPDYPPDWFRHTEDELYLNLVEQYARRVQEPEPGNIAMFSLGRVRGAHAGIVTHWPYIVCAWPLSLRVDEVNVHQSPHFKDHLEGWYDPFLGPD